jgi:hypothetical protein
LRASKTEAAVNYEDMICLHEVLQLLRELECLGFVKRTGEFQHGYPVHVATYPTFNRSAQRDDMGGASGTNDCQGKDTQWIP